MNSINPLFQLNSKIPLLLSGLLIMRPPNRILFIVIIIATNRPTIILRYDIIHWRRSHYMRGLLILLLEWWWVNIVVIVVINILLHFCRHQLTSPEPYHWVHDIFGALFHYQRQLILKIDIPQPWQIIHKLISHQP